MLHNQLPMLLPLHFILSFIQHEKRHGESMSDLENLTVSTYFPLPSSTHHKTVAIIDIIESLKSSRMLSAHFSSAFRSPSSSICFWHLRHFHFDNFFLLKLFHYSMAMNENPTPRYVYMCVLWVKHLMLLKDDFHHFIFALYSAHTRLTAIMVGILSII